jgi:hypothetical protein
MLSDLVSCQGIYNGSTFVERLRSKGKGKMVQGEEKAVAETS